MVLETFGAGNAPQRKDLMTALREACERGVVIVAITQCAKGSVSNAYETGRTLLEAGVVPGGDMTPEVSTPTFFKARTERVDVTTIPKECSSGRLVGRADQAQLSPLQTGTLR